MVSVRTHVAGILQGSEMMADLMISVAPSRSNTVSLSSLHPSFLLFLPPLLTQIFSEHLLCARSCGRLWLELL